MFDLRDVHHVALILVSPILVALALGLPLFPAVVATAVTALLLCLRVLTAGHWRLIVPAVHDTGD